MAEECGSALPPSPVLGLHCFSLPYSCLRHHNPIKSKLIPLLVECGLTFGTSRTQNLSRLLDTFFFFFFLKANDPEGRAGGGAICA